MCFVPVQINSSPCNKLIAGHRQPGWRHCPTRGYCIQCEQGGSTNHHRVTAGLSGTRTTPHSCPRLTNRSHPAKLHAAATSVGQPLAACEPEHCADSSCMRCRASSRVLCMLRSFCSPAHKSAQHGWPIELCHISDCAGAACAAWCLVAVVMQHRLREIPGCLCTAHLLLPGSFPFHTTHITNSGP